MTPEEVQTLIDRWADAVKQQDIANAEERRLAAELYDAIGCPGETGLLIEVEERPALLLGGAGYQYRYRHLRTLEESLKDGGEVPF